MGHLKVDPELAFSTSRLLSNDAIELHEQLTRLERGWENLSRGWSGVASSAYSPIWAEWLDGATTLVDSLEDLSQKLALSASRYAEQDDSSAESIESVSMDLGL